MDTQVMEPEYIELSTDERLEIIDERLTRIIESLRLLELNLQCALVDLSLVVRHIRQ